jgi:hypothetical protein
MMQGIFSSNAHRDKETQVEVDPHITCAFCSTMSVVEDIPCHTKRNQHDNGGVDRLAEPHERD